MMSYTHGEQELYLNAVHTAVTINEKTGDKEEYQAFFNKTLKKFKVTSPEQLSKDQKKEFYDAIDKGWVGDHEEKDKDLDEGIHSDRANYMVQTKLKQNFVDKVKKILPGAKTSYSNIKIPNGEVIKGLAIKLPFDNSKAEYTMLIQWEKFIPSKYTKKVPDSIQDIDGKVTDLTNKDSWTVWSYKSMKNINVGTVRWVNVKSDRNPEKILQYLKYINRKGFVEHVTHGEGSIILEHPDNTFDVMFETELIKNMTYDMLIESPESKKKKVKKSDKTQSTPDKILLNPILEQLQKLQESNFDPVLDEMLDESNIAILKTLYGPYELDEDSVLFDSELNLFFSVNEEEYIDESENETILAHINTNIQI